MQSKDIINKSKDGTALNSFRISVPAADLQKALDPTIWPLRVKVREYVFYPRKSKTTNSSKTDPDNIASQQAQNGENQAESDRCVDTVSTVQTQGELAQSLPLSNRFDLLANEGCNGSLP